MDTTVVLSRAAQERRWGDGRRVCASDARSRLLDAALFCYEHNGYAKTSILDIARQAKVTRPTVYRYFSCQRDLVLAVLQRELIALLQETHNALAAHRDFADYLATALLRMTENSGNSSSKLLFAAEYRDFTESILLNDRIFRAAQLSLWQDRHARLFADNGHRVDLAILCEFFNRMLISYRYKDDQTGADLGHAFRNLFDRLLTSNK